MLEAIAHAKTVRDRLRNPVNGRQSTELDISSSSVLRQRRNHMSRGGHYLQASSQESRQSRERGFIEAYEIVRVISLLSISRMVARYYGLTVEHMVSQQKTASIVRPRQIVMYLAKEHTKLSLTSIGKRIRGMDHTTILHGVRRIKQLMEMDVRLAAEVENFERDLRCWLGNKAAA